MVQEKIAKADAVAHYLCAKFFRSCWFVAYREPKVRRYDVFG